MKTEDVFGRVALKDQKTGGTIMRSIIQDGSDDWPPTKEGALHIIRGGRKWKNQ